MINVPEAHRIPPQPDGLAPSHPGQLQYQPHLPQYSPGEAFKNKQDFSQYPWLKHGLELGGAIFAFVEGKRLLDGWQQEYMRAVQENGGEHLSPEQLKDVALSVLRGHAGYLGEKMNSSHAPVSSASNAHPEMTSDGSSTPPDAYSGNMPPPTAPIHQMVAMGPNLAKNAPFDSESAMPSVQNEAPKRRGLVDWWKYNYEREPVVHFLTDQYRYYEDRLKNDPIRLAMVRRGIYPDPPSRWIQNIKDMVPNRFRRKNTANYTN